MSVRQVIDERGEFNAHCFELGGGTGGEHDVVSLRQGPPVPVAQAVVPATPAAQVATPAKRQVSAAGLTTRQLITELRARLKVVERELRTRRDLEKERDQIRRLISAATNERDNLRRIRVAG